MIIKRYYKGSTKEIESLQLWYDEDYYNELTGKTKISKVEKKTKIKQKPMVSELDGFLQKNPTTIIQLASMIGGHKGWEKYEEKIVEQIEENISEINYLGNLINRFPESVNSLKHLEGTDLEFLTIEIGRRGNSTKKEDIGISTLVTEYDDTLIEMKKIGEEKE